MAFDKILITGEKLTEEKFKSPSIEFSLLPFWFWNGNMDEKEMEWQMKEYYNKGIKGIFLHGRFGEKIGYLSDVWLEKAKYAAEKAKEIGMDLWIYDEMNWPSGTANKKVPQKYPHLKQKYLELCILPVNGPLFTFLEATDDRYVNTGNSKPIVAYACTEEEYNTEIRNIIDLTPNLSFDAVIPWEAPEGKWKLLYFLEKEIDYYIDALNPESTKRFLEETHEKYKNVVGNYFGSVIPGFYTDEPAMHYYHVGMTNYIIPWTSQMFKIFRERNGYDLKPYLPALFMNMGDITPKIRYDFWNTLTEQYSESYYKQIRNWCEKNNLLFTGHLLGEEWLWMHARCEGNIFKHLKHFNIIGVDHLYPIIGTKDNPDQHVALKIASSAAHHYGSKRVLCESMGGTYWDCTLERMKWIANWEYVLGVNIFNNHGYHYSIEGERKRDWPPSQFYHHTWWKYYNYFTDYIKRIGYALTDGKHVAKILMLYPITSAWTNYTPSGTNDIFNTIQNEFNFLTDALLRLHYDFDYVDEDILNDAIIKNGKIIINEEEYSLLILPPITHVKKETLNSIKKFLSSGGKLISSSLIPLGVVESKDNNYGKLIKRVFGIDPNVMYENYIKQSKTCIISRKKNIIIFTGEELYKKRNYKLLQKAIEKFITPDVTISDGDIFYHHRKQNDYDIYFLTNTSRLDKHNVKVTFENIGIPSLWNANDGSIKPVYNYRIINNRLELTLNFNGTDSHIVILKKGLPQKYITTSNMTIESFNEYKIIGFTDVEDENIFVSLKDRNKTHKYSIAPQKNKEIIKFKNDFEFEIENENVLCLDKFRMKMIENGDDIPKLVSKDCDDSNWLNVTTGAWELQLPQERNEQNYPVHLVYRTDFKVEQMPKNLSILIDGFSGKSYRLFINGKEIFERGTRSNLDAEINEINISKYVEIGQNLIAICLEVVRRTDGILDLIKIIGDFSLSKRGNYYIIKDTNKKLKIGSWTKQGFPFYSGTGVYKQIVNIPEKYLNCKLFLECDVGEDIAEIVVNGEIVKVLPWKPYVADITNYIKVGNNEIKIKVTNTLINMLEAVEKESGLLRQPYIKPYNIYEFYYKNEDKYEKK
ncbi:glycosyl hydrolase [Ignavibacteria bacterium 4148-Me]|uniref:glycosyl hydrolase n=1 Tax=Rosettibacter primus TaxID=3111523 RepID=UPI00336BDCE1